MAHPLARAGALDLLEEAVHALRATPPATIVLHWIGSVPFARWACWSFGIACHSRARRMRFAPWRRSHWRYWCCG
jgi:hypothetical protein